MNDVIDRIAEIAPVLFQEAGTTLWIVAASLVFGGIAGLVVGTALTVTRKGAVLAQPVVFWILNALVNTFRPVPFIILLAALQPLARVVGGGSATR
jgi:D-methionine transport system permease protein